MQTCVTRNVRKLADGQVVYTAMCHPTGGMIDDGTVFRITRQNFRWIGGQLGYSGIWLREQAERLGLNVWVRNSTEQLHNLQVQGPNSRQLLSEAIWTRPDQPTVEELGWFRFAIARIGDYDGIPLVLSRTGYTGELGYEVFCHPTDAPAVWDAIFEVGAGHGLVPMGLSALDMLRIEAGLVFAGHEFCDQTDPYEAGIGFTVPLKTKEDDFIGRDALLSRRDNPQRRLVGLQLEGGEPGGARRRCVRGAQPRRRDHQRHHLAHPAQEHRPVPHVGGVLRDRHGRRGGQAGRPREADRSRGGALPVLRSGQVSGTRHRLDPRPATGVSGAVARRCKTGRRSTLIA